jgi:hypothetical protein
VILAPDSLQNLEEQIAVLGSVEDGTSLVTARGEEM